MKFRPIPFQKDQPITVHLDYKVETIYLFEIRLNNFLSLSFSRFRFGYVRALDMICNMEFEQK